MLHDTATREPPPAIDVLIVQSDAALATAWAQPLRRMGARTTHCATAEAAIAALQAQPVHAVLLDMVLAGGNALTVADMAAFRQPQAALICITASGFFDAGTIFAHCGTARMVLGRQLPATELAEVVSHYAMRSAAAVG